jgi:hypothetical protein
MTVTFRYKLTLVFVVGCAWAALGQAAGLMLSRIELNGTVVQVNPPGVQVKAANGQTWILNLQQGRPQVKVTGTAEPEMLMQGTCVRFTARIDKRSSKGQEKIDKITIFTPTPGVAERTLGVERASDRPQGQDGANAGGRPRRGPPAGPQGPPPGAGPDPAAPPDLAPPEDGADGGKTPKRRGATAKAAKKSVPDVADYDICAQVVSVHAGRMIVNVPNEFFKPRITVDLAKDAQIGLDLGLRDIACVKPGDKFSADVLYLKPGVGYMVETLEIALTDPLTLPGRSHHPRPVAHANDAARQPAGKAKAGAATGKNAQAAGAATAEKPPAKKPETEGPDIALPAEKDNPPPAKAQTKPEPVAPDDDVMPPAEETKPDVKKPDAKKPDEKPAPKNPEKKPPVKDDEKDVFEK